MKARGLNACVAGLVLSVLGAGGCENSLPDRSLIFFTGTTLGLEVAVNPSSSDSPARVIIGYKRGEGVMNPVYHSKGVTAPAEETTTETKPDKTVVTTTKPSGDEGINRYRDQAYSVLAKFTAESAGSAGNAAAARQSLGSWFATGPAADILASQPGIAGAVTGNADIAEAVSKGGANLGGDARPLPLRAIASIYVITGNDTSEVAVRTRGELDAAAAAIKIDGSSTLYKQGDKTLEADGVAASVLGTPHTFGSVEELATRLEESAGFIDTAVSKDFQIKTGDQKRAMSDIEKAALPEVAKSLRAQSEAIRTSLEKDPRVAAAVKTYFGRILSAGKASR